MSEIVYRKQGACEEKVTSIMEPAEKKLHIDFKALRDHCIEIRKEYNLYCNLFCEENRDILTKVAAAFFFDIAAIIHRDWKLQVCKIMDREEMNGKENITIDLINSRLQDNNLLNTEIEDTTAKLKCFGTKISTARNKRLAHFDRKAHFNGQPLGGTSERELLEFLSELQNYCNQVGELIGLGPLDFSCCAIQGDEQDLLKQLKLVVK
ncbi:hypothetical protein [Kiloniella antarctica]|uniref:HEPN AbiU2-like domain-containing protein n=1 Tax=Kiloniella antarctica TaxID=1550907 RepID=A0ABW5BI20_9PROT